MPDRREMLLGGALQLVFLAVGGATCACAAAEQMRGCRMPHDRVATSLRGARRLSFKAEDHSNTSGDRDLDRALAQTLAYISDQFDVLPGFAFLQDGAAPNAYASTSQVLGRKDGSVLFGLKLLERTLKLPEHPDAHVAAICAHEFGHICQFKLGVIDKLEKGFSTGKRVELHADYLAGFYAGLRRRERRDFPAAVVALAQYNLGDDAINDPDHHGTPDERGRAVVEGYKASFERGDGFGAAFDKGVAWARTLP
jgi:hypothetical protein